MNDNDDTRPSVEPSQGHVTMADMDISQMGDIEGMSNMRAWLEGALKAKGAKVTGGGIGMGSADVEMTLEGFKYDVSIMPRIKG